MQRIADIDGWEGIRLAISAEVKKQFALKLENVPDFEAFANQVARRGALGAAFALGFDEKACATRSSLGR